MSKESDDFSVFLPSEKLDEDFEEGGLDPMYYILQYRLKDKINQFLDQGKEKGKYKLVELKDIALRRKEKLDDERSSMIYEILAQDIDRVTGTLKGINRKPRKEITSGYPLAEVGDIIFLRMRPYLRKVVIIPEKISIDGENVELRDLPIVCSSEFCILQMKSQSSISSISIEGQLSSEYLWAILRSNITLFQILPLIKGGTRPRISFQKLLNTKIPVPEKRNKRQEIVKEMKKLQEKIEEFRRIRKKRIRDYKNTLGKNISSKLGIKKMKSLDEDLARLLIEGDLLPESYFSDFY